jgi:hypothetical protein
MRALNVLGLWLLVHVKMLYFFTTHVQTILNFSPYAARSSMHDKKRQIEAGMENVSYKSLLRPSLYISVCLYFFSLPFFCPSFFITLSFLRIFTV